MNRRGDASFYRRASVLRGRVVVDHGAASPASGRAGRGCSDALRVQARLMAATAWSGRAWLGRVASRQVAAMAGSSSPFTAAAVQGLVVAMSGGVQVASASSTASQRGQGECEVVAREVARARPCTCWRDASGVQGAFWARCLRRVSSSSSTMAMLGWRRSLVGARWRGGQGRGARRGEGARRARGHGRHGHALACSLSLLASLCSI
jgi:hypothetical protein